MYPNGGQQMIIGSRRNYTNNLEDRRAKARARYALKHPHIKAIV